MAFDNLLAKLKEKEERTTVSCRNSALYILESMLETGLDITITKDLAMVYFTNIGIPYNSETLPSLMSLYEPQIDTYYREHFLSLLYIIKTDLFKEYSS